MYKYLLVNQKKWNWQDCKKQLPIGIKSCCNLQQKGLDPHKQVHFLESVVHTQQEYLVTLTSQNKQIIAAMIKHYIYLSNSDNLMDGRREALKIATKRTNPIWTKLANTARRDRPDSARGNLFIYNGNYRYLYWSVLLSIPTVNTTGIVGH